MIRFYAKRVWGFLWRYSFFRFICFHGPAGALNYGIAFSLFWYFDFNMYAATIVGHIVHVCIAFFYDRDITYRAKEKRGLQAFGQYWLNDLVSFCSILLTLYVLIDLYSVHLVLAERFAIDNKQAIVLVRAGPAMLVGTLLAYGLNKIWTFNETTKPPTLS